MAIIIERGKVLHIQWYDPIAKKVNSKSTGLKINEQNRKKAEQFAKKLQHELTKRNDGYKQMGLTHVTIKDAFEHFLRNNQQKHPKTIKDYYRFYKKFIEYFDENGACTAINKMNVENWFIEIKKLPQQQNSIHSYGKQCVHFLNFLFEYSYTTMFKINREVRTRPQVKEKLVFSDQDIVKLFENVKVKDSNFQTLLYLLFYTGLRPTDLMTLQCDKIDLENHSFSYYSPKRKLFREIAFHEDLVPILKNRISEVNIGKIFNYSSGDNIGRAVHRYLVNLGLDTKGYSARTFRKTFITLCRSKFNMDPSIVKELVGHEHGNTTDKYYNKIGLREMQKALKKFIRPGTGKLELIKLCE